MVDKISPTDPRIAYKTAKLNGVTYNYILSEPKDGKVVDTIFLIHGWPDLSLGWRYQIPLLTSLGLRVIVPDMMGYAGTDAPASIEFYTYKRSADDIAELAKQLNLSSIILGGHDWGGAVVYRIAMRYPKLISAVFSVCTPFFPPRKEFMDAGAVLPNFKYQLQLRGPEVEATIIGEEKIRQFLNGMYGGRTPSKETTFEVSNGVFFERLDKVGASPLLSKDEMDWYVKQYSRQGMQGPLNWYRTGELNYKDDLDFVAKFEEGFQFEIPFLYIGATKDDALPVAMSTGMDKFFKSLTRKEVEASHWALWEKPADVNRHIKDFLEGTVKGSKL